MDPRTRRREEDLRRLRALAAQYPDSVEVVAVSGTPPQRIQLRLRIPTARDERYPRTLLDSTELLIELADAYPLQEPRLTVRPVVFNPNVFVSGIVCHGTRWHATERLDLLVIRVMRLLALDPAIVNPRSAANGIAAAWYRVAMARDPWAFPSMEIEPPQQAPRPLVGWGDAVAPGKRLIDCTGCDVKLRVDDGRDGTVVCPRCGAHVEVRA